MYANSSCVQVRLDLIFFDGLIDMRKNEKLLFNLALAMFALSACTNVDEQKTKAAQGDAEAQYYRGCACQNGSMGETVDLVKAKNWYKLASAQNYADADCALGWMYFKGLGVKSEKPKAVQFYCKAINERPNKMHREIIIDDPQPDSRREMRAPDRIQQLKKKAEEGDARARFNLGASYDYGWFVKQSYPEAVKWYESAAELDEPDAETNLANLYLQGTHVPKNEPKAIELFVRAALQQHNPAVKMLDAIDHETAQAIDDEYFRISIKHQLFLWFWRLLIPAVILLALVQFIPFIQSRTWLTMTIAIIAYPLLLGAVVCMSIWGSADTLNSWFGWHL